MKFFLIPSIRKLRAIITDGTTDLHLDSLSEAMTMVNAEHHEIHEGVSFITDIVDESMANSDTLTLAFKTPTGTKAAHLIVDFATLAGGHVDLIEGPTWDNQTGTKSPIYNRKRETSMTSSILLEDQAQASFIASDNVILNPTNLVSGTIIHDLWGFGAKEKFGAVGRDVEEFILKPDTQYAVRFTSDSGSNKGHLILNWYEIG